MGGRPSDPPIEPAIRSGNSPPVSGRDGKLAESELDRIAGSVERRYRQGARVLSFSGYLELCAAHPVRHGRSASMYVRDMFEYYGREVVKRPWGERVRHRLFDAPWQQSGGAREATLVGHEELQGEIYRVLSNFAREGRANRLVLMHGPNGSAKSTAAACIMRALEEYSETDEGALYRFHWVFPSRRTSRGAIGFGGGEPARELDSYAELSEEDVDARLVIELRDHPLFLLPPDERRLLVGRLWANAGVDGAPPEWLMVGELSHKNKQIFEALLVSYEGSLRDVLRHVQVERYFISRRYRVGAVTLGPQMHVDAGERQITADRSLAALPTSLQATTLWEAHGELVEANGGVLEFSDLLKRPIDAFRYLQLTLETGEVPLAQQTIYVNLVMIGSANEVHMVAFREHPEYPSFRGRLELVRVPYLRSYLEEERIYLTQIVPQLRCHVAPHAIRVAAEFAVLTRMRRPDPKRYAKPLGAVVEGLTAVEKIVLYAEGTPPARLSAEERKLLKANVGLLYGETDADLDYEGRVGASPREVRTLLLDAAQLPEYKCLSPFAVLKCIDELCKRTAEFEWLKLKPLSGGYHDHKHFREQVRERLLDRIEVDMRVASALIDEMRYDELFRRYLTHVSAWVKNEKLHNPVTGKDESPDEKMMRDVEALLEVEREPREHRDTMISMIAAWALDHPGERPPHREIFPGYVERMQSSAFKGLRKPFSTLLHDLVISLREQGKGLEPQRRGEADRMLARLRDLGYNDDSVLDAASNLVRDRFAEVT
jgi:predicted Ser/Thr protein kinase